MARINHLEIYRHLKKTNCGYCQVRTCMAFALAVAGGGRKIDDCPYVNPEIARELIGRLGGNVARKDWREELEERIGPLRKDVSAVDFGRVAEGLGGMIVNGKLCLKCLGKEFRIDRNGNIESEAHVNPWVTVPLLNYIREGGSGGLSGKWMSLDELSTGAIRGQYFSKRCEEPLRRLMDEHGALFSDIMDMFSAEKVDGFSSDRAWKIFPLPKLPFLILHWQAEEEFQSKLKLLLDRNAETYLDPESIYVLGRGLVEMFERIISRHRAVKPDVI